MATPVITRPQKIRALQSVQWRRPWWRRIGQVLASLLITLPVSILLLEGYFRLAGVGGQEFLCPDLQMGCRHIAGKQVIWRMEGYSNDRLSSAGLRDSEHALKKEPGIYRIVLLGDSVVEALQVGLNDTFGKVLESLLNKQLHLPKSSKFKRFEVINFGCSSYSTGQEVLQYEKEASKFQPDAVVLLYNRGDSIENIVTKKDRRNVEPRPYFYLDQSGQLQQDNSILAANFNKLKPPPIIEWLRGHSTIYGVLNQADLALTINEPKYRKFKGWMNRIGEWALGGPSSKRTDSRPPLPFQRSNIGLNEESALMQIQPSPADMNYPDQNNMAVMKALIRRLASQTAARKQPLILITFPNVATNAELSEQANELKAIAQDKQFIYLDLTQSFLADRQPANRFIQYHFSKNGHRLVAQDLYRAFTDKSNAL